MRARRDSDKVCGIVRTLCKLFVREKVPKLSGNFQASNSLIGRAIHSSISGASLRQSKRVSWSTGSKHVKPARSTYRTPLNIYPNMQSRYGFRGEGVVTTKVSTAMYSQSRRGSWLKFIGAKTQSFRYVCSGSSQSDGLGSPKMGVRVDLFEHARRVS
jgi:hypothetical protein